MKKLLAMLLAALMCLTGIAALAENALEGSIDEGSWRTPSWCASIPSPTARPPCP